MPAPDPARVAVRMAGIRRRFGSTVALDGVDLTVRRGEIHAVLGANGAGKTTLMRILAGLDRPDAGTVEVDGGRIEAFDPAHARSLGIALVQQHFTLVPTLTASANLVLARPEGRLRPSPRRARRRLTALVERFGLDVPDGVPASRLSVGEQQRLEVLRALDADAQVLVLDEPTAVLTDAEADTLLAVCRSLAEEGRAVVVITHRLREVVAGCDRVTVLRDGRVVVDGDDVAAHDRSALATAMIGTASTGGFSERRPGDAGAPRAADHGDVGDGHRGLSVRRLHLGALHDVCLEVHPGEVVAVAGIDGNGQAELEAAVAGLRSPDSGAVVVGGEPVAVGDPRARRRAGIAYVPSDRYRHGLVRPMSLADNLEIGRSGRIRERRARRHAFAARRLADWSVRAAGPDATAASLSGGNAQKLVLARELDGDPSVVVACYPTRGLDPGAAAAVAARLVETAAGGSAVLWIGAELDELFAVAERIVVLADGRVTGEFTFPFDREAIGLAMTTTASTTVTTADRVDRRKAIVT